MCAFLIKRKNQVKRVLFTKFFSIGPKLIHLNPTQNQASGFSHVRATVVWFVSMRAFLEEEKSCEMRSIYQQILFKIKFT
jgi:hypothetical protein